MFYIIGNAANYPGLDGWLGTRGSFMLDLVFVAMFLVIPIMGVSIALARYRGLWDLHKRIQLALASVLLVAVLAFEVDMHLLTDWQARAAPSPYFDSAARWSSPVGVTLLVHLFFAVPTAILWFYVIVDALRRYPVPPRPTSYSPRHRFWGRVAAVEMLMTALTGWLFYWMAFVA